MSPRKKNVTAKDIARACGLSQATVSYVMNNKEGKKNQRSHPPAWCWKTARELNYIPNSTARSMRTNRSMSIGVVTGWNNLSMGFSLVLRGVKEYLDAAGYSITLLHDDVNAKNDHEYVRYYRSARIDGLLFLFYEMEPETMALLQRERIPFFPGGRKRRMAHGGPKPHPLRGRYPAGRYPFAGNGASGASSFSPCSGGIPCFQRNGTYSPGPFRRNSPRRNSSGWRSQPMGKKTRACGNSFIRPCARTRRTQLFLPTPAPAGWYRGPSSGGNSPCPPRCATSAWPPPVFLNWPTPPSPAWICPWRKWANTPPGRLSGASRACR